MFFIFETSALYVLIILSSWNICEVFTDDGTNAQPTCPQPLKQCKTDAIEFYLYNKLNTEDDGYELQLDNENTIKNAKFTDQPIKFIIHGLGESRQDDRMVNLRKAYLDTDCWNIIFIDYGKIADMSCYDLTLVFSVPILGQCSATLLEKLHDIQHIQYSRYSILGFSIGAHVAAVMSNHFPPNTFVRLTGLDPALPFYPPENVPQTHVLSKQHAQFVDVIHTCAGSLGVADSHAHVDIYANTNIPAYCQPGCKDCDIRCAHDRAVDYFIESIIGNDKLVAEKCEKFDANQNVCVTVSKNADPIYVGEPCRKPKDDGKYVFRTNSSPPFAIPASKLPTTDPSVCMN